MSEVVDQRKMGLMMGLFNLSVVLPQIVASNLGGFIEGSADKTSIFWISTITLGGQCLALATGEGTAQGRERRCRVDGGGH
jgi:hypothetical protein